MKNEFYVPDKEQVRLQNKINHQGRSDDTLSDEETDSILDDFRKTQEYVFAEYNSLLEKDIARELARINLPLSTYTEWYWKIDLHNLLHFLNLRLDHHAQYEIRVYAKIIKEIITLFVPIVMESFEDYILSSQSFSKQELSVLKEIIGNEAPSEDLIKKHGIKGLEATEFKEKLKLLFD